MTKIAGYNNMATSVFIMKISGSIVIEVGFRFMKKKEAQLFLQQQTNK